MRRSGARATPEGVLVLRPVRDDSVVSEDSPGIGHGVFPAYGPAFSVGASTYTLTERRHDAFLRVGAQVIEDQMDLPDTFVPTIDAPQCSRKGPAGSAAQELRDPNAPGAAASLVATEGRYPDTTPAQHGPPAAAFPPLLASAVRGARRSGPGARGRTVIRPGGALDGSAEAQAVPFGIDALVRQTAGRTADARVRRGGEGRRAGGLRGRAAARRVGGWLLHNPAARRAGRDRIATPARVVPVLAGTRAQPARQTLRRDREWTAGRTPTWR